MRDRHERPFFTIMIVLTMLAAMCVTSTGCAAVKALGPMLIEYGLERAEDLAAKGKDAIDEARKRAEAIPDQLDRIEAIAECNRAELIYQTTLLEAMAEATLDAEWVVIPVPEPEPAPAPVEPDA